MGIKSDRLCLRRLNAGSHSYNSTGIRFAGCYSSLLLFFFIILTLHTWKNSFYSNPIIPSPHPCPCFVCLCEHMPEYEWALYWLPALHAISVDVILASGGSREGNNRGTYPLHISWQLFKIHRSYIKGKSTAEGKGRKGEGGAEEEREGTSVRNRCVIEV